MPVMIKNHFIHKGEKSSTENIAHFYPFVEIPFREGGFSTRLQKRRFHADLDRGGAERSEYPPSQFVGGKRPPPRP